MQQDQRFRDETQFQRKRRESINKERFRPTFGIDPIGIQIGQSRLITDMFIRLGRFGIDETARPSASFRFGLVRHLRNPESNMREREHQHRLISIKPCVCAFSTLSLILTMEMIVQCGTRDKSRKLASGWKKGSSQSSRWEPREVGVWVEMGKW